MTRPPKVQRIEDWDEARYSVTPPRAALDPRLTLIHFRLMSMLGRVNTRQGWCDMSQTAFAEALGYNRGSVVAAVKQLVEWRYIEKNGQEKTGTSRCHYRLLIDEPEAPGETACETGDDAPPAAPEGVSEGTGSGECHVPDDTGECHVAGDTSVMSRESPVSCIKDTLLDQRSKITPPNPQRGDAAPGEQAGSFGEGGTNGKILAELRLRGDIPAPVMAHLVEPVLAAKRFSDATPAATLADIARRARDLAKPALDRAARELVGAKVATLKAERIRAAIETSRKVGAALMIRPGMPEWAAWQRHWASAEPRQGKIAAQAGSWMVPSQWPPRSHGEPQGESAGVSP